jgi:hypothetical protein
LVELVKLVPIKFILSLPIMKDYIGTNKIDILEYGIKYILSNKDDILNFNINKLDELDELDEESDDNTSRKECISNISTIKSNTKKAKDIHEYFIKLEEILHEVIQEESNELKLKLLQYSFFNWLCW